MNGFVKPFPAPGSEVIAVIGGGFSGTLVAVNLARAAGDRSLRIVLFERAARFARGVAYATPSPQHLLNVPAAMMSALVDQPGHFLAWLRALALRGRRFRSDKSGAVAGRPLTLGTHQLN